MLVFAMVNVALGNSSMQQLRPLIAAHPMHFGRGRTWLLHVISAAPANLSDDVKLFAGTFLAGFLFVSILIG